MENNFGGTPPYTVGIEEEFQLVTPATGELAPAAEKVLAASAALDYLAPELSQSCLELVSPVFEDIASISRELPALRGELAESVHGCGLDLVAAGTHPFSNPLEQPLMPGERFAGVEREMGWVARTQAIYGLHVHVAVPDSEAAIRAVNTLAGYTPLLLALSANSPYWRGVDTRLSSARIKIFEIFPRSGLPPAFRDWEEFERHVEIFVRSGSIPDYTWCWWDVRPHPKFGTVEVRALDAQTDVSRTAALAALIQCLVASFRRKNRRRAPGVPVVHRREQVARHPLRARRPVLRLRALKKRYQPARWPETSWRSCARSHKTSAARTSWKE